MLNTERNVWDREEDAQELFREYLQLKDEKQIQKVIKSYINALGDKSTDTRTYIHKTSYLRSTTAYLLSRIKSQSSDIVLQLIRDVLGLNDPKLTEGIAYFIGYSGEEKLFYDINELQPQNIEYVKDSLRRKLEELEAFKKNGKFISFNGTTAKSKFDGMYVHEHQPKFMLSIKFPFWRWQFGRIISHIPENFLKNISFQLVRRPHLWATLLL